MTNQRPRKRNSPEKVSCSLLAVFILLIRFVWNLATTASPFLSNLNPFAKISFLFYSQGYGPATRSSRRKRKAVDLKENDESDSNENVLDYSRDKMSENDELEAAQDEIMHENLDIEKAMWNEPGRLSFLSVVTDGSFAQMPVCLLIHPFACPRYSCNNGYIWWSTLLYWNYYCVYLIYYFSQQTFASVTAKDSKCNATSDLPFVLENYNNR